VREPALARRGWSSAMIRFDVAEQGVAPLVERRRVRRPQPTAGVFGDSAMR